MEELNSKAYLKTLANTKMPFGKYKGYYLIDIPEYYLLWYKQKGFPKNKLGLQMQEILELKVNGLEDIIRPLKNS
ncbi:DUF3820 family protein [Mesohalobacter halotolerans]|uniref:DUF3820 family protein n=1 Tax=Mesohalobacter halotolerans TaxID=1883405 RepID=A0A4U5TPP3_9FLAO|nr:DUF3820 family protein [Mesohalobacter halotolerans]MBS3738068.1 DUF3820 family protein [Psychroflexus sp.]NBC57117.1 hypothetical protein [Bacteroidota bacterium]TKS56099.1 hypothetical protein FCN74_08760 [Mesohalobacter halotolerans]